MGRDGQPATTEAIAEAIEAHLAGRRVGTAESVTAGRIATELARVPGAVEFLAGGLVAYQVATKRALLGVETDSVLCPEAAEQMAAGACRLLRCEVAVATTGLAGSDGEEGVPGGTVFMAAQVDGVVTSAVHRYDGDPDEVCAAAARDALAHLLAALTDDDGDPPAG